MSAQPLHQPPGEGQRYEVLGGDVITIKASGDDTGGAFAVLETVVPAGGGPPRHVHSREDEAFYVVEGEFEFCVGEAVTAAPAGSFLIAPRGVPHHFRNAGAAAGKLLVVCRPAGFERFVVEFADLPVDQPPDAARMAEIGARHGITFVAE